MRLVNFWVSTFVCEYDSFVRGKYQVNQVLGKILSGKRYENAISNQL